MIELASKSDLSEQPYNAGTANSRLTMFKNTSGLDSSIRNIHAPRLEPESSPEPNLEPDPAASAAHSDIAPADWDMLFHAVIERLETCAGHAPPEQMAEHALGVTAALQATLLECVASMNHLHAALSRERQERLLCK